MRGPQQHHSGGPEILCRCVVRTSRPAYSLNDKKDVPRQATQWIYSVDAVHSGLPPRTLWVSQGSPAQDSLCCHECIVMVLGRPLELGE